MRKERKKEGNKAEIKERKGRRIGKGNVLRERGNLK
jgi:hypothetical protein